MNLPINLKTDPIIQTLTNELTTHYNCHTIIVYGSRARGKATSVSDYDIAGISKINAKTRVARFDSQHQVFIDLFVYPESELSTLQDEHLCMHDGIVLKEEDKFGVNLLTEINKIINESPQLADYELNVRKVWYEKMLTRAQIRDIDGMYRHVWVLYTLIEDYFAFRGVRYLGPKKAFEYLEEHDNAFLKKYENALNHIDDLEALQLVIQATLGKKL